MNATAKTTSEQLQGWVEVKNFWTAYQNLKPVNGIKNVPARIAAAEAKIEELTAAVAKVGA